MLKLGRFRYFSGHTKDINGNVEFVKGQTKVSKAVDGVIKIFTIAVCASSDKVFYICFLSFNVKWGF